MIACEMTYQSSLTTTFRLLQHFPSPQVIVRDYEKRRNKRKKETEKNTITRAITPKLSASAQNEKKNAILLSLNQVS